MLGYLAHHLGICLACLLVGKYLLRDSTEWYGDYDILGIGTCRARAMAILAILGKLVTLILEVYKCPVLAITLKDDAAALATIATIGATECHKLLATEVTRARTAMS